MTYQVPVSDIKCRRSGVKFNISSADVRYHVSSIACQVSVSDITCQRSSVKYSMLSVGVNTEYNIIY